MPAVTKSITLQEDKPSLRVTLVCVSSISFCVSKAILHFWRSSTPQKSHFFVKFRHPTRATGATMQNLGVVQTFLYPMDRAEVLHAQSYDLSGRRENTPGENELVLSCEIFDFPIFSIT